MPRLHQGRVVFSRIAVPDPQGRNPKARRKFIVISSDDEIALGHRIVAVAVTGKFEHGDSGQLVELAWGPDSWAGLSKPSVAHCGSTIDVPAGELEVSKYKVPATDLLHILETYDPIRAGD